MTITGRATSPMRRRTLAGFAIAFFAAIGTLLGASGPASADEVGEDLDYQLTGTIQFQGQPLEGVGVSISGNDYEAETETDADGRWKIGVPEKGESPYVFTVDEETLPEGVIVDPAQLPEAVQPVQGTTGSFEIVDPKADPPSSFGQTKNKTFNLFLAPGERIVTSWVDQLVERIVNGLNFGLMLALGAIGASLIYGTTGLSNFAHGELMTFGAVVASALGTVGAGMLGWPMWIVIPIVLVAALVFGYAQDRLLWTPLRRRGLGLIQLTIVTIGFSLLLRYVIQFFFGGNTRQLPGADTDVKIQLIGPIRLGVIEMISMAVSIVLIIGVAIWLTKSKTGKATRAISDNPSLAAASGIDVDRVVRLVWVISTVLAAIGGILWAYFRPGVTWNMGTAVLLLIFASITLGGLGTAYGALVGSLIVGMLVEISTLWLSPDLKYVTALVILIVLLLFRPQGILGRRERLG